jgi:tetratricopeptide (TPR) repeat protein
LQSYYNDKDPRKKKDAECLLTQTQLREERNLAGDVTLRHARNNAAIGDVIVHQAQCLFGLRDYPKAKIVLENWQMVSESRLEKLYWRQIRSALGKNLVFMKRYEEAETTLHQVLAEANPEAPFKELNEFNWAIVILGQLYCKVAKYEEALELVAPRVVRFKQARRNMEPITSDFRLIMCEALLQVGRYGEFELELSSLEQDLQLPGQASNCRTSTQLLEVKRLWARSYYLRKSWPQAVDAWRLVLVHLGVEEDDALTPHFQQQHRGNFRIAEALYSLAMTHYQLGDLNRAMTYIQLVTSEPASLKHPSEEFDYSGWLCRMRDEYRAASTRPRRRYRLLRGLLCASTIEDVSDRSSNTSPVQYRLPELPESSPLYQSSSKGSGGEC